jgi:5'(3')-deoxyribonucleotidase
MKKLGIDLDGTLFRTYSTLKDEFEKFWKKPLDVAKLRDPQTISTLPPKEMEWIFDHFQKQKSYEVPPYPYAVSVIRKLAGKYDIYFVSARPQIAYLDTKRILRNYGILGDGKHLVLCEKPDKPQVYEALKFDIIIEDDDQNLLVPNITGYFFLRPWSIPIKKSSIIVVKSWLEVEKHLVGGG